MRILAVGDTFMRPSYFAQAFAELEQSHDVETIQIDASREFTPSTPSERKLREYQGCPAELVARMSGVDVLVVQGAPVTDEVLDSSSRLRLVCCARGGPVNVDVEAVSKRRLPLVNTPGKNAEAVADLTLMFAVTLARRLPSAERFVAEGNQLADNWDGAQFFGNDLRRHTLGLVGYGQVARRVAIRARAFGMRVLTFDPFVQTDEVEQVASLDELLAESDFVSLHARATAANENLIDAEALAAIRRGGFLINTARETLVDENALDGALASGHLAGAALDTVRQTHDPGPHPLLRHRNVVITPHIGGATHETMLQGAEMIAAEIERFAAGEPLVNVVNRTAAAA